MSSSTLRLLLMLTLICFLVAHSLAMLWYGLQHELTGIWNTGQIHTALPAALGYSALLAALQQHSSALVQLQASAAWSGVVSPLGFSTRAGGESSLRARAIMSSSAVHPILAQRCRPWP
jgi:hypothetical protein